MDKVNGVYFILAKNQKKIKIGRSKNVYKRFSNLRTGFMDDGEIVLILEDPSEVTLESEIHKRFKDERIHGEWFYLSNNLKNFIITEVHTNYLVYYANYSILKSVNSIENFEVYSYLYKLKNANNDKLVLACLILYGCVISSYHLKYSILGYESDINASISYLYAFIFAIAAPLYGMKTYFSGPLSYFKSYIYLITLTFIYIILSSVFIFPSVVDLIIKLLFLFGFIHFVKFYGYHLLDLNQKAKDEKEALLTFSKKDNYTNDEKLSLLTSKINTNKKKILTIKKVGTILNLFNVTILVSALIIVINLNYQYVDDWYWSLIIIIFILPMAYIYIYEYIKDKMPKVKINYLTGIFSLLFLYIHYRAFSLGDKLSEINQIAMLLYLFTNLIINISIIILTSRLKQKNYYFQKNIKNNQSITTK